MADDICFISKYELNTLWAATSTTVVDFIWFNFLDDEHNSLLETPFRSSSNPYQAFFIHLLFSKALRMQVLTRVPLSFLYCSN